MILLSDSFEGEENLATIELLMSKIMGFSRAILSSFNIELEMGEALFCF
jgi:hypothetical protein